MLIVQAQLRTAAFMRLKLGTGMQLLSEFFRRDLSTTRPRRALVGFHLAQVKPCRPTLHFLGLELVLVLRVTDGTARTCLGSGE